MNTNKGSGLNKLMPYVLSVGMLAFVAACGSDDDNDNNNNQPELEAYQNFNYRAVLAPINESGAVGTATVRRDQDEFEVEITLANAPTTTHTQHIRTGTVCASATNDANKDGFVDAVEAEAASGQVLISLDSDLSSQDAGGVYPVGRSYRYSESNSWSTMIANLNSPTSLAGRVIEIHGTTVSLPATVSGSHDETASRSLPIACGVLVLIPPEGSEDTGSNGTTGTSI